jgi:HAD superfamily hydrolase (TIGR01509 family)
MAQIAGEGFHGAAERIVRAGARCPRMNEADPSLVAGIEAVLFDLDGVLVDTEPWWHEVRVAWAGARGRAWRPRDSRLCMGRSSREWSEIMRDRLRVADAPIDIERAIVAALVERYASEPVPLVAGAPEAVAAVAARVPVAIASSAHPAVIRAAIAAAGLAPLFAAIVSSDDVARGKPAPDVYLEAARRLGVAPARCLVIEDSRNGVLAGRAAGMRVVLVPNASVPPGPGVAETADAVLGRLADLPVASLGAVA